jgi:hypothetical protein
MLIARSSWPSKFWPRAQRLSNLSAGRCGLRCYANHPGVSISIGRIRLFASFQLARAKICFETHFEEVVPSIALKPNSLPFAPLPRRHFFTHSRRLTRRARNTSASFHIMALLSFRSTLHSVTPFLIPFDAGRDEEFQPWSVASLVCTLSTSGLIDRNAIRPLMARKWRNQKLFLASLT